MTHQIGDEDESLAIHPDNELFYTEKIFTQLNHDADEIRLFLVHSSRYTWNQLSSAFPHWMKEGTDAWKPAQGSEHESASFICCEVIEPLSLEDLRGKFSVVTYYRQRSTEAKRIMVEGYWFNVCAGFEQALDRFRGLCQIKRDDCMQWIWTDELCLQQPLHDDCLHNLGLITKVHQMAERIFVVLQPFESGPQEGYNVERGELLLKELINWIQTRQDPAKGHEHTSSYLRFIAEMNQESRPTPSVDLLFLQDIIGKMRSASATMLKGMRRPAKSTEAQDSSSFSVRPNLYFMYGSFCYLGRDLDPLLHEQQSYTLEEISEDPNLAEDQKRLLQMISSLRHTSISNDELARSHLGAQFGPIDSSLKGYLNPDEAIKETMGAWSYDKFLMDLWFSALFQRKDSKQFRSGSVNRR